MSNVSLDLGSAIYVFSSDFRYECGKMTLKRFLNCPNRRKMEIVEMRELPVISRKVAFYIKNGKMQLFNTPA